MMNAFVTTPNPARIAAATASAEILIDAGAERIWQLLTDVGRWPEWNPAVSSATLRGPLRRGAVFVWRSQGFKITSTLQRVEAFSSLAWTGSALGTEAFHSWTLTSTGSEVRVSTFETFDGWLPRLFRASMQKKLALTLPAWLAALKAAAELRSDAFGHPAGRPRAAPAASCAADE